MDTRLLPEDSGLLIIDWQARLCAAMPEAVIERSTKNVTHLMNLAEKLGLPVVMTEQYPKGLGSTIERVAALAPAPAHAKTMFSAWRDPAARAAIEGSGRRRWIVVGIEAHICVYQTARDLVDAGFAVHVPGDGVVSRTKHNWRNGLSLIAAAGGLITNTEAAMFDLLGEGRGEAFKMVSRAIR